MSLGIEIIPLIKSLGYLGVWSILFLESGLILFFFLPGDSLLFAAGFLASQGYLNIFTLTTGCFIAAVLGNMVGYEVGRRLGLRAFEGLEGRFIKRKHLDVTRAFYDRHGAMTVILARFLPIVRTFTPFLAGMVEMNYIRFMLYTVIGALAWAVGLTVLGFLFGQIIPPDQVDKYLLPIILAIIVLSVLPSLFHLRKEYKLSRQAE